MDGIDGFRRGHDFVNGDGVYDPASRTFNIAPSLLLYRPTLPKRLYIQFRQKQIFTTSQQSSSTNSQSRSQGGGIAPANAPQVIHANNYRSVIVRIGAYFSVLLREMTAYAHCVSVNCVALYPLASMLVNALSIMTALHSTISSGINTQNVSRHLTVYPHTVYLELTNITLLGL